MRQEMWYFLKLVLPTIWFKLTSGDPEFLVVRVPNLNDLVPSLNDIVLNLTILNQI